MTKREVPRAVLGAVTFCLLYAAVGTILLRALPESGVIVPGLFAAIIATVASSILFDRHPLAVAVVDRPANIARYLGSGLLWAAGFAVVADLLTQLGQLRHGLGGRVDGLEIATLFLPAALHEELVFRGYAFQKVAGISAPLSVIGGSILFTVLHLGNSGLSAIGVLNIFLAGVVLSLSFLWRRSLWFPIGAHFSWNFVTGPLLGHEVSGYRPKGALLTTFDRGPELVTGGEFGVEGSLGVTALAIVAISLLMWRISQNQKEQIPVVAEA